MSPKTVNEIESRASEPRSQRAADPTREAYRAGKNRVGRGPGRWVLAATGIAGLLLALGMPTAGAGAPVYQAQIWEGGPSSNLGTFDSQATATPPATISGGGQVAHDCCSYSQIGSYFVESGRGTARISGGAYGVSQYGVSFTWRERASWSWDDVIFTCSNGETSVPVGMNVRLKGNLTTAEPYYQGVVPTAILSVRLGDYNFLYNAGVWYARSNIGSPGFVGTGNGIFSGINSDSLDNVFTYPLFNFVSSGFTFPTGVPVRVDPYPLIVELEDASGGIAADFASGDKGMSLPTTGTVFNLPQGCTCNSQQANIVDNHWLGVDPLVSVSGRVLSDCEGPLAGVTVELIDAAGASSFGVTGSQGEYAFANVPSSTSQGTVVVTAPAGFGAVNPILIPLTTSQNAPDITLACVYVSVSGSVSSDCHGSEAGVPVSLAVAGRDPISTATGTDGSYSLSARYSATPGDLSITIPSGLGAQVPAGGTTQVALTANQSADFTLHCDQVQVRVSGTVASDCHGSLAGVTVDLLDAQGQFHTTTTDGSGGYLFEGLTSSATVDAAEVSIAIPLGYEAVSPGVAGAALTLDRDRAANFSVACLDPTGSPRGMGYWKHNANVYLSGRGSPQEADADMRTNFPAAIFSHFHENALNEIAVAGVTYRNATPEPLDLATVGATLDLKGNQTMLARAKQQYLALLLNMASGKILTGTVVTADGGTASQVVQYIADLINDGNNSNDELAKNLSETVNDAQVIASGVVPLAQYGNIAYALPQFADRPLQVSPNPGNGGEAPFVFSFAMPLAGEATLDIYDASGRRVATPLSRSMVAGQQRVVWTGNAADGGRVGQGIYFARLTTAEGAKMVKFVQMGR